MAFRVLEKQKSSFGPKPATEKRVSITKYKGASLHLNVSSALAVALGWEKTNKAAVSVGSGPDDGWLLVEKATSGYAMSSSGGAKTCALKIGVTGVLDHLTQVNVTPCKFNIVNRSLYIEIPERLRAAKPANSPGRSTPDMNGELRQQPFTLPGDAYISPRAG
jgi:hypothetical protein